MTNQMTTAFEFEAINVRVVTDDNGDPWWAARDVTVALGYAPSSDITNLVSKIPAEWKGTKPFRTLGGVQDIIALSEAGLFFFLARSNMDKALPFQKWIAGEVLPSIRRTGRYAVPTRPVDPTSLGLPDFTDPIAAAQAWIDQAKRIREVETTVAAQAPMVAFAQAVGTSDDTISVNALAKMAAQNGVDIGQNRLFTWMREKGYIMRDGRNNIPTQSALDAGWLVVRESIVVTPNGHSKVTITTKVTGKGQVYFMRKLLPETGIVKA